MKLMLSQHVISNEVRDLNDEEISRSPRNDKSVALEAVGFGMGALAADIHQGDVIDVAYTIDENTWNGNTKLQLKIKDIQI